MREAKPASSATRPRSESRKSDFLPRSRGLFGASRLDGVNRERVEAAAQISRTLKAWRSASASEIEPTRDADEDQPQAAKKPPVRKNRVAFMEDDARSWQLRRNR